MHGREESTIREVLDDIARWRTNGGRVAVARVVAIEGSAPRELGATMVINADGRVAGSVSGGCVESAVVAESFAALESGEVRLVRFGYSDDEAFAVGLTCGGELEILITPDLPPTYEHLEAALRVDDPVVLATVVSCADLQTDQAEGSAFTYRRDHSDAIDEVPPFTAPGNSILVRPDGHVEGSLGQPGLQAAVAEDAIGTLGDGRSSLRHYGPHGEARGLEVAVFLEAFTPAPRLVIFGAVDFTAALARVAKVLGYRVTVCDARATFATPERFPMADEIVVDWPQRYLEAIGAELGPRDALCVLTHDARFDVPAILAALSTGVGYIGVMGSRRTHAARLERLVATGAAPEALERVMAPIGLDIGSRTPEETAISICAEIIAKRSGRDGQSLRDNKGPIHGAAAVMGQ